MRTIFFLSRVEPFELAGSNGRADYVLSGQSGSLGVLVNWE